MGARTDTSRDLVRGHGRWGRVGAVAPLLGEQPPQHVGENAAVAQVLALARGVEADAGAELLAVGAHRHLARLGVLDAEDRELLAAGQAERLAALARPELAR